MTRTNKRKPAAFKVEEVELFEPPVPPPLPVEPTPLPVTRIPSLPALDRGLRWGTILFGALGGLLALVLLALAMIILREVAGLARLGRLGKIRHEADSASRQNDKPLAIDV